MSKADDRVTLIVRFIDGTSIQLPRADRPAAEATIEARYRTTLVASVMIARFP